jgi:hypothetical protein
MAKTSNNAPSLKWVKLPHFGVLRRQRLFLNGRETPYFVDTALTIAHYTQGDRHGLFGSGMSERGCAVTLGSASKVSVLKHRAEQYALERVQF